ncbi:DUF4902 domain-containing protein [Trinickia violacea]|uniref:DUF4902 domain-containing protein n=1 Tax=Trinickia violacea TaxID=2571746 RepID=A0A4P8IYV1_9BURK|nr:DUF4902 domain-containing protein [Trinickia violacea]QCP53751.1 DUF4902 domain-containing protein [Trinickia violacea]
MKPSPALLHSPSPDGYVRVPECVLADLQLVHVDSGIDESLLSDLRASDVDAVRAGYTEWQRMRRPGAAHISVGWDWYLDRTTGALLVAWDDVRSNIMCIDRRGLDLGMARTAKALICRLAQLNWPNEVANAVLVPRFNLRACGSGLH